MKINSKLISRSLFIVPILIAAVFIISKPHAAQALSGSQWNAGKIISDTQFYNNNSMSVNDIQNFLNSRVSDCDTQGTQSAADVGYPNLNHAQYATQIKGWPGPPYVCLKDYMQVPDSTQIISNFQGSNPPGSISAAQIIKNAADTYGISPKVLLVMLQKESLNLIYDSWPMLSQYKNSMGYACPDTAPCDPQYAGFYNQMHNAARQFKLYQTNAGSYRYKPFQNNLISYQANAPSCGASNVYVENYATAGLYNYTPYQPNTAALDNLYGTGDSCSAYGNRNFWRVYNDWFGSTEYEETLLSFKSHIGYVGWTDTSVNYGVTGVVGQSKSMEAFKINGDVEYSSYNVNSGWQPTVRNGMISGTVDQKKPIQAIKINPTGTLADRYDIYYRAHVSYVGWMGWTKNGAIAGVTGDSAKNIEAFEVLLIPKGLSAPGSTANAYLNSGTVTTTPQLSISATSHISGLGWQSTVTDGMVSGTTEQNRAVEALTLNLNNNTGLTGGIAYSTQLAYLGWQDIKVSGEQAGTVGQFRAVEAIRMKLTGQLGENYDLWYRGYVQYMGWNGWSKNGTPAGSVGASRNLEAFEIRILPKNSNILTEQSGLYNPTSKPMPDDYSLIYSTHISYVGWSPEVAQNNISGSIGQSKSLEAVKIGFSRSLEGSLDINCSAYVTGQGWLENISANNNCGTVGQKKSLEAIKLTLSGDAASKYELYYKVHLAWVGWKDWVKGGTVTGTPSSNQPIEAIIIKLVKK